MKLQFSDLIIATALNNISLQWMMRKGTPAKPQIGSYIVH
jgi:hypothetical protein